MYFKLWDLLPPKLNRKGDCCISITTMKKHYSIYVKYEYNEHISLINARYMIIFTNGFYVIGAAPKLIRKADKCCLSAALEEKKRCCTYKI